MRLTDAYPSSQRLSSQLRADTGTAVCSPQRQVSHLRGETAAVCWNEGIDPQGVEHRERQRQRCRKRIQVCWPDMKNQWRAVADGVNLVAGEMNLEEMRFDIEISQFNCGSAEQAQTLAASMRQWEYTDRLGYFLPLHINIVADLNGCTYGRDPKGLGKGQGAAQRQTFAGGGKGQGAAPALAYNQPGQDPLQATDPWRAGQAAGSQAPAAVSFAPGPTPPPYNYGTAAATPIATKIEITNADGTKVELGQTRELASSGVVSSELGQAREQASSGAVSS
jgi:hypothetical protein